jgi:hypothetical protein
MKFNKRAILFFLLFYQFVNCVVLAQNIIKLVLNNEVADFNHFVHSPIIADGRNEEGSSAESFEISFENGKVPLGMELYNWLKNTIDPQLVSKKDFVIRIKNAEGFELQMYNVNGAYPVNAQEIPSREEPGKAFFESVRFIADYVQQVYD